MGRRWTLLASVAAAALMLPASSASAADGDLVPAFSGDGKLTGDFGGSATNEILGAATQPDGKLVVVGRADDLGIVARVTTAGALDTTFGGGDGIVVVDAGPAAFNETLKDVAIQPDGNIVAVGDAAATGNDIVMVRLDSNGVLDDTFDGPGGGDGIFRIDPGASFGTGEAIALSGAKLIVAAIVDSHSRVYQLNANGSLDTAGFAAPNGFVQFDFPCGINCNFQSFLSGVAIQPGDGKIVAVGKPNNLAAGIGVARITTAGTLDTASFNSPTGMATLAPPAGYIGGNGEDVTVNAAGDIRIAGLLAAAESPSFPNDAAVAAVTSSGSLDTAGFGAGTGYAIVPSSGDGDAAYGIAEQTDGKLLIGGALGDFGSLDFMTARFLSSGAPDASYGTSGVATTDFAGENSDARASALSATGIAYVGGIAGSGSPTSFGVTAFAAATPDAPELTDTNPDSGSNDNAPRVIGTAETGTTVDLWSNGTCTGPAALTGQPAANLASPGLAVSVANNSSTTFSAKATNVSGASACSTVNVTYEEETPLPGAPTLSGTDPASGSNDNGPKVVGTALPGATVELWANGTCAGDPAVSAQPAASLQSPGLPVTVADNSTTTFSSKQTIVSDAVTGTSACSTVNATYSEVTPPAPSGGGGQPAVPVAKKCRKGFKKKKVKGKVKCVKKKKRRK